MHFGVLQNGEASLPDRRVRTPFRRGTGILGIGLQSSGALLLDDLHFGTHTHPPTYYTTPKLIKHSQILYIPLFYLFNYDFWGVKTIRVI